MKVTQEKLPASQMGLEIEVSPEMSKQAYEQVIQEFSRSANIPGFRKGKVPRQILLQRLGSQRLKAATLEDLIQKSVQQAIEQEKIQAIGNYQLRSSFEELITQFVPGQAFTFSAAVDVQPEVKLTGYSGLSIKAEEVKPKPEQVDQVLEDYRNRRATLVPIEDRAAQMGDVAFVDFQASFPDEDMEPWEQENFQVELAADKFVPGFVDGIVGMNLGETKELNIQFPAEYMLQEAAGKSAVFTVTLKELKEKEPPALDDEFAQSISEFETLAELRESLEKRYQEEAERKTIANKERAFLDELLNCVEVDLPETLVEQEITYMLTQTAMQLQNQGFDYRQIFTREAIPELRERSRLEATKRIKRSLALGEIAKQESIKADPAKIAEKVDEYVKNVEDKTSIDLERIRSTVEEDVLKEAIFKWLEEHSTIELVPEGSLAQAEEDEAAEQVAAEAGATEPASAEAAAEVVASADVEVLPPENESGASEASAPSKSSKGSSKSSKAKSK